MASQSVILRVNGPVVFASEMGLAGLGEQVDVGDEKLAGEIIALEDDVATIQVYEGLLGTSPG